MGSSHTHNGKMPAIVETFKNWDPCQLQARSSRLHQLYLQWFRDTKCSNSRQVCRARELSWYRFHINYSEGKANEATDALSHFPQEELGRGEISSSWKLKSFTRCSHCWPTPTSPDIYTPSAPNSYLWNARPPFVTSILEMRFGKRRPSSEMLDGWEDVKEVVHHQGLSYVPENIWT